MAADGSIIIETLLDDKDAQKELTRLNNRIKTLNNQIYTNQRMKMPLVEQSKQAAANLDFARAALEKMKAASAGTYTADQIARQDETVKSLQKHWEGIQSRVEAYDRSIRTANEKLNIAKEQAGEIQQRMAAAGVDAEKMAKATAKAKKHTQGFATQLKYAMSSIILYGGLFQIFSGLTQWLGKVIKVNDEASAAVARLKGALLTLAQPLLNVIIPAFSTLVNILADFISFIAILVSAIFGMTGEEAADAADGLYDETEAIEGVGNAAKKAAKNLAAFDEINRLTGNTGSSSGAASDVIQPDFSAIKELDGILKNLATDLALKIQSIKFDWDNGTIAQNKDAWIVALTSILGLVIGSMFGGIWGGAIGLLLGAAIGLISCTFLDKLSNPSAFKEGFIVVLGTILGAVLGTIFSGFGAGTVIGLLLGALITLISLEFAKGEQSNWDSQDTLVVVLSAILGAILGGFFGGLAGGVIGFLLGALISFVAIKFSEGNYNKSEAIASLRIVIFAILGAIMGAWFGGPVGAGIGLVLGLTVGFASVAFDEKLEASVRSAAEKALTIALTTIIGALIGAIFGAGVFGGIIGGVIGLAFGLAITLNDATITDKTGFSGVRGNGFSGSGGGGGSFGRSAFSSMPSVSNYSIPKLATGAVIPPNREFLAVLGDQKQGTNVEAPLSAIEQAVANVMSRMGYGAEQTVILQVDKDQLGKVVYKLNKAESRRIGVNLAGV